jgi:uncharacterized protein (TIGR02001 family)
MKNHLALLAATGALALTPTLATAQAATPAPAFTGNLTLASDYRFRGISQTFRLPALQGGIDWENPAGFYLGNWNSSLSGVQYDGSSGLEMDFYGGYKFEIARGVTLDVGGLYYYYPGATDANNFEVYGGAEVGPFTAKLFYGVTDFFGLADSKGSYYADLAYSIEIFGKTTLDLHVGYQSVRRNSELNYTDYKVGITRDVGGWLLGAAFVGTDAAKGVYVATNAAGRTRQLAEPGLVLSLGKTF